MKKNLPALILLLLALIAPITSSWAQDLATAQKQIEARQTKLATLEQQGAIGENNQGFVETRPGAPANTGDLCTAENNDRKVLYAELAKRAGTNVAEAGRSRAKQIAAKIAKGVWVQDDKGAWAKK